VRALTFPRLVLESLALVGLAVAPACSSTDAREPADEGLVEGFHPPAPQSGEVRLVAPLVQNIPPGGDVTWCSYVKNPFDREVDVVTSRGFQSKTGHHALLMDVPGSEDRLGESHPCTDRDMTNARFLAGGSDGAAKFKIPEGVAFRVRPQSVLMVQTHWINTTKETMTGQAVFNIGTRVPDGTRQTAQLFAAYTAKVDLAPRAPAHAHTECTMKSDIKFFSIGGHAHEWGRHVSLTVDRGGKREVIYDKDWEVAYQSDPPLNYYDPKAPLELHAGDVLIVDCEYANTTDDAIHFPREMCVGVGFYFPGNADIQCGDGRWIQGQSSEGALQ
jgi:hypothetical protein